MIDRLTDLSVRGTVAVAVFYIVFNIMDLIDRDELIQSYAKLRSQHLNPA